MSTPVPTPVITDFGSLAGLRAQARANDPAALKKAAQQFEALFTQQLLKSARAANLGDDVMGGGQTAFYQDLFDQQMALHLSTGKGMGLADMLVKQMQGVGGKTPAAANPGEIHALSDLRGLLPAPHAVSANEASSTAASPDAQAFVDELRPHAERAAKELGVPAHVILAQAAIETGWGKHVPAKADGSSSHNYFGIKAGGSWSGDTLEKPTHEVIGGRVQQVAAKFRSYHSIGEAFDDYVSFLKSSPRYAQALENGDAKGFALGLQKAGYATDPAYSGKLLKVAHGPSLSAALSASDVAGASHAPHRVRTWTA
jgi:flagellar protein FlgJ